MRSIATDVVRRPWAVIRSLSHHRAAARTLQKVGSGSANAAPLLEPFRTTSWVWRDAAIARSMAEGCCLRRLPQPSVRSFSRCLRRTCQISGRQTASDPRAPTHGFTQADQASVVSSVFFSPRWKRSWPVGCPHAQCRRRDRVVGRGRCCQHEIRHCRFQFGREETGSNIVCCRLSDNGAFIRPKAARRRYRHETAK